MLAKNVILEQCEGVYCVDLGESFQMSTYLLFTYKLWLRYSRERALYSLPYAVDLPDIVRDHAEDVAAPEHLPRCGENPASDPSSAYAATERKPKVGLKKTDHHRPPSV